MPSGVASCGNLTATIYSCETLSEQYGQAAEWLLGEGQRQSGNRLRGRNHDVMLMCHGIRAE